MNRLALMAAAGVAAILTSVPSALAGDFAFGPLQRVSPSGSPYGATTSGPDCAPGQAGHDYPGAEVEPWVTFHGDYGVASWQQDRWSNGGSNGLPVAVTHDGGTTWAMPGSQPGFTCAAAGTAPDAASGGVVFERASDPWTAISADGSTAYAMALVFDGTDFVNGMEVSRSTNGGTTWSTPKLLVRDTSANTLNDKNSLTADPRIAANAYAIWDRLAFPNDRSNPTAGENAIGYRGPTYFSKTENFGSSWSTARKIYDPGEVNQTIGNQIVVLGDGTLVDGFNLIYNFKNTGKARGYNVATITSTDHGDTWSKQAKVVSPLRSVGVPGVRSGDILPEIAADPRAGSTTFYLVWQDAAPSGGAYDQVVMTKCDGAGGSVSCGPVQRVNEDTGQAAFTPSIGVRGDGTLAITYYQLTGSGYETKTVAYHRHPDGSSSRQDIPGGTFDMGTAANAGGLFVGDYEGLGENAGKFVPFFVGTDGDQQSSACSTDASETETAGAGDCGF